MTKKKFAGLELSFLHYSRMVPEMNLVVYPMIQQAVGLVGHPFL